METQSALECATKQGDSPVATIEQAVKVSGVPLPGNGVGSWGPHTSNRKYVSRPIAYKYREGTLKRTFDKESKEPETS